MVCPYCSYAACASSVKRLLAGYMPPAAYEIMPEQHYFINKGSARSANSEQSSFGCVFEPFALRLFSQENAALSSIAEIDLNHELRKMKLLWQQQPAR